MKNYVIKQTFMYWWIKKLRTYLIKIKYADLFQTKCKILNHGHYKINKTIIGQKGKLIIGKNSILDHVDIRIVGMNNTINIGKNCYIGKNCSIWLEGNNITVTIGNGCNFTHDTQICAQENNSCITIGNDCMLSHHINIRTSDSHIIYDTITGKRLNYSQSVTIGNHVWIAPEVKIMKGCNIGDCSIIGSNAIVTHSTPANSLVVGIPAKVVKNNVDWKRDKLF